MNVPAHMQQARTSWLALMAADEHIERGVRDGLQGQPVASDHPAYYDGWVRGSRCFRASNRELVIMLAPGSKCRACGVCGAGYFDSCPVACKHFGPSGVMYGGICLYGPPDDGPEFISNAELRLLVNQGLLVVDGEGDPLNANFLIQ